jgi:catechol 2,3-dioxygenase-like lactoylglutathione lyase family enzyme
MTQSPFVGDRRECLIWAGALIGAAAAGSPAFAADKAAPPSDSKTSFPIKGLGPFGLSVRDIDKSALFYGALGFTLGEKYDMPHSAAKASGAADPDARMSMQQISWGATNLLLVQFDPPVAAAPGEGPAARRGLSNLELMVDDVDRAANQIRALGGVVLDGTRSTLTDLGTPPLHMVLCQDPDGTMIALVHEDNK